MGTIVISEQVELPAWIVDHATFLEWARSEKYPARGKVSYLNGDIWVDLSMEKLIHNLLKTLITSTLFAIASEKRMGHVLGDRMMLTNLEVGLSTEPDGLFFSHESLEQERVHFSEGEDSLEVEGCPDQTLEVISKNSVRKDTLILPALYWKAGIREYWLVDPRKKPAALTIFRHGREGYQPVRKQSGWQKSIVFGLFFRLFAVNEDGPVPEYRLEYK